MRQWNAFFAVVFSVFFVPRVLAQSPEGRWTIKDEKTGEIRAVVQMSLSNHELNGTIVKSYPRPGETRICSACPGSFQGKTILGLQFLWGLKSKGNGEWGDGYVLDPKTGKIYRAQISLKDDTLSVRGYIGFSLLGRSQIWVR